MQTEFQSTTTVNQNICAATSLAANETFAMAYRLAFVARMRRIAQVPMRPVGSPSAAANAQTAQGYTNA